MERGLGTVLTGRVHPPLPYREPFLFIKFTYNLYINTTGTMGEVERLYRDASDSPLDGRWVPVGRRPIAAGPLAGASASRVDSIASILLLQGIFLSTEPRHRPDKKSIGTMRVRSYIITRNQMYSSSYISFFTARVSLTL